MRAIGKKGSRYPIDQNECTGCVSVGFFKGKILSLPYHKRQDFNSVFAPFLLKRKDKRYTYGIFYYGDYNFKNVGLRNRGRSCGMGSNQPSGRIRK